jgi:tetratricopeptide (TPR) repeat protein
MAGLLGLGWWWAVAAAAAVPKGEAVPVADDVSDPAFWVALAEREADPDRAARLFREALRLSPAHVPALVGLGLALAGTGPVEEAVPVLQHAVALAPDDPAPAVALASVRDDLALARATLARFPEDPAAALLVARLDPGAETTALAGAAPTRAVMVARAEAALGAGDMTAARSAAMALDARLPEAESFARWFVCFDSGTADAALWRTLRQAARTAMTRPGVWVAVDLPPKAERCAAAHAELALASDPARAVSHLRVAVALAPDDTGLAVAFGRALLVAQSHAEAASVLAAASAARPWDVDAALLHAEAVSRMDARAATRILEAVRTAFPDNPHAGRKLAALRGDDGPRSAPSRVELIAAGIDDVEEIVVYGERESERLLAVIATKMRDLGYGAATRDIHGNVFFPGTDRYHPWVRLFPDGSFDVEQVDRKHSGGRNDLFAALTDDLIAWRSALCAEAIEDRLVSEIPEALEALWERGVPVSPGPPLDTPEERRSALLTWWATRTCTPEGERVREVIARYVVTEVQRSPWPVTDAELAAANGRRSCQDPLVLVP